VQREAKVQAMWEVKKDTPGNAYRSYTHLRAAMYRKTGC
jgi:hypothetical protein